MAPLNRVPDKRPTRGRDRRAVEVRREEILTATTDLIDRIGLAAIRVSDVAKVLGVSPALVCYHFGTKDALVADAFAYAVDRDLSKLDQAMGRGTDPKDQLRRVLRLCGPPGQATGWRVWIDSWALAQREPVIRKVLRRLDQRWSAALLEVIEAGWPTARSPASIPPLQWRGSRPCSTGWWSRRSSTARSHAPSCGSGLPVQWRANSGSTQRH